MDGVDVHEWGPTEPDETAVLSRLFGRVGDDFSFRVGSLVPDTVATVLNEASKWIGTSGRPNVFTREYAGHHGNAFLTASWCDMFVTYLGHHGPALSVIPNGDRAFTPWHAGDFVTRHRFYAGTPTNVRAYAMAGTVLFFDWGGSDQPGNVDHVGLVVKNLGDGRVITEEGNTSDRVALRVRGADVIAIVASPLYQGRPPVTPPTADPNAWPYAPGVLMRRGWTASAGVRKVQTKIDVLGYLPRLLADGDFGAKTESAVKWFQTRAHITVDGVVGPVTWSKLFQ
jgi:peptidoglycan hydrolase-like protein with peptidoglycan-binding domain